MFDVFKKYLLHKIELSVADLELIRSVSTVKKLRKKQYLLQEGDVWRYNAFISKGLVRSYSIDNRGQEHIMQFAPENHWTGDRESLLTGEPSKYNIDALEASELVLIKKPDFETICKALPRLNDLVNAIIQRSFIAQQQRIHANITLSAEEKYNNFIEKFPHIINRVPQHMIASYLGIAPETLTRVRNIAAKPKIS